MPGTFVIDTDKTFTVAFLMSCDKKLKFGEQVQDVNATGVPKWALEVAVTFTTENGMKPVSEVLSVSVAAPTSPAEHIAPGSPVVLDGFRVGSNPPEKNDRGGIRGGKLWFTAAAVRPAGPAAASKRDAA